VAFDTLRKWHFEEAVNSLLDLMMGHFVRIDERLDLREEDKRRLKQYYLEHLMRPRSKALLQRCFPEDFGGKAPTTVDELEEILGTPARSKTDPAS
jgi:hypothetical protein